jgi:predicted nucleotidyltransferase
MQHRSAEIDTPPVATAGPRPAVRLSAAQIALIRGAAERHFGPGVKVRVFGSRADLSRRGGDIDLHVEPPEPVDDALTRELRLHAALQRALGEQRIDLIVRRPDQPERPIDREARRTGVLL